MRLQRRLPWFAARLCTWGGTLGFFASMSACNLIEEANFSLEDEVSEQLKLSADPSTPAPMVSFTYPTSATVILNAADAGNQTFTGT